MLDAVRRTIQDLGQLAEGHGLLAAVSGGADSMAMLDCLDRLADELGFRLEVAHVDHGLRPGAADDAGFVAGAASRRGLKFHLGAVDAAAAARELGTSVQDAAHRLRMEFLEATRLARGLDWTAVGHSRDDQAETVLLHFLRGAGPTGLSGLRAVDPPLVRPLLYVSREEIEAHCRYHDIAFREDPTNAEPTYLRNRIRLEILPVLRDKVNPNLTAGLSAAAQVMADVSDLLEQLGSEALQDCSLGDDALALSGAAFSVLHPALQREVVRLVFARWAGGPRDLERSHVEAVRRLWLQGRHGARLDLPLGGRVWVEHGTLMVGSVERWQELQPAGVAEYSYRLDVPGSVRVREAGLVVDAALLERAMVPEDALAGRSGQPEGPAETTASSGVPWLARDAYIDYNRVDLPLEVRNRRPGDRFRPLSLGGSQKVKDYFIAGKIPPGLRDLIPLVFTGEQLVWVAGFRLDERFKIGKDTEMVVHLRVTAETSVSESGKRPPGRE